MKLYLYRVANEQIFSNSTNKDTELIAITDVEERYDYISNYINNNISDYI